MLAIKLQRIGRKHQPSYRMVVAEKRSKLAGPPVEDLGFYNPFSKAFEVKGERVKYWIGVGAIPTITAHNLLVKNGVIEGKAVRVAMPRPVAKVVEEPVAAEAPVEEAPAEVTQAEETPVEENQE